MSKLSKSGIENALNIPSAEELNEALAIIREGGVSENELYCFEDEEEKVELSVDEIKELVKNARTERSSIKQEHDISQRQKRLEEISNMSSKYFEDIMDKAFNAEDKFTSDMINSAASLLKVAADAETALINSDTKMAELQLKKEKQDYENNKLKLKEMAQNNNSNATINGEAVTILDRNALLKEINESNK